MTQLSDNTKFRVIVGPVSWYTTAKQIREGEGVGDLLQCNCALIEALMALESTRSGAGPAEGATSGISGHWRGLNVQLDIQR